MMPSCTVQSTICSGFLKFNKKPTATVPANPANLEGKSVIVLGVCVCVWAFWLSANGGRENLNPVIMCSTNGTEGALSISILDFLLILLQLQ